MPDFEPKEYGVGDSLTPEDVTEVNREIEELEDEVNQIFQEWIGALHSGVDYSSGNLDVPLDPSGRSPLGVLISAVAPGPGGGSGARGAPGMVRAGGGGAGSAPQVREFFLPVSPGDKFAVFMSKAGKGGDAVITDNTPGNAGTNGTMAYFRLMDSSLNFKLYVKVYANSATIVGQGGTIHATTASGTGGSAYQGGVTAGTQGGNASSTGGVGGNGTAPVNGAGASAGAGGGITSANVANNGGNGARQYNWSANTSNIAGGIVDGALPGNGDSPLPGGYPGDSPAGGAASITGAAQAGADGLGYGAPGAGGGASTNGNNSGRGGHGGPAYVGARWVYA